MSDTPLEMYIPEIYKVKSQGAAMKNQEIIDFLNNVKMPINARQLIVHAIQKLQKPYTFNNFFKELAVTTYRRQRRHQLKIQLIKEVAAFQQALPSYDYCQRLIEKCEEDLPGIIAETARNLQSKQGDVYE